MPIAFVLPRYRCGLGLAVLVLACVAGPATADDARPKLLDLGAKSCIPCKMMAPLLADLGKEFAGTFDVAFVDLSEPANAAIGARHAVESIPTQIWLDAQGKELARHVGFISRHGLLAQWRELGYDFAAKALASPLTRYAPPPVRPAGPCCFLCDGALDPTATVSVPSDKGAVQLCGAHHFFVMLSCLQQDVAKTEAKATITDATTGQPLAMAAAFYLTGLEEPTGRPWVQAFATRPAAVAAGAKRGGAPVGYAVLKRKELANRCGFCDRSVYPEDAAQVKVAGLQTWGCCSHCALGVAARTGANLEVTQPDALTGEPVVVATAGGYVAAVTPPTAVAWFGKRLAADGKWVSAGCFYQGFFTSAENLKRWLAQHPDARGEQISIDQALADKMALTPAQIVKACKIGECSPK